LRKEQEALRNEIIRNNDELENLKGRKRESLQNKINAFTLDLEDIGYEADKIEVKLRKEEKELQMMDKEIEMTEKIISEVQASNSYAGELSTEEKLELEKLIEYFKEQNLLDDILGEE